MRIAEEGIEKLKYWNSFHYSCTNLTPLTVTEVNGEIKWEFGKVYKPYSAHLFVPANWGNEEVDKYIKSVCKN